MVIFRANNASWSRRMQFSAFAGLVSISILAGGSQGLRADWFSFKKNPPPADALEPQTNEGFDRAIRNLLKEANRLEKKGELDQAIILADRAAKISEESSSLVKISSDISAPVLSEYANSLRKKKHQIELELKRAKRQNTNAAAIESSRLAKETSAKDKASHLPQAKPPAAVAAVAIPVRSKENSETALESTFGDAPSSSRRESRLKDASSTSATANSVSRHVSDPERDDLKLPAESIAAPAKAVRTTTIVPPTEEPPFEPFVEDESRQTHAPQDIRSFPNGTVATEEVVQTESVDAQPDAENVTLISSSSIDSGNSTNLPETQVVKLRYRYRETEPQTTVSNKSKSNSNDIRNLETESNVKTASLAAGESLNEREKQTPADLRDDEFPVIQIKDLRQTSEISSALERGEPQPTSIISKDESPETGEEPQFAPTKTLSPFRIRRTLKLRNTYSVLPLLTPIVARPVREPVVGRTSIVHWRPAKESFSTATGDSNVQNNMMTATSAAEIRRMQSDNDRSIIDHVSTGIRHGSARDLEIQTASEAVTDLRDESKARQSSASHSTARREIRGSLWDNAAAPTFEATWKSAKPQSENPRSAPLPPKSNRIEQTAFTPPLRSVKRDLRSEMNRDSIEASVQVSESSIESSSEAPDFGEITEEEKPDESESWMDEPESTDNVVNNDLIQTASRTGLPESTVSTMLGAFGIALLIAGIWMVRATAGIKHD